jgi:hypothetical protein
MIHTLYWDAIHESINQTGKYNETGNTTTNDIQEQCKCSAAKYNWPLHNLDKSTIIHSMLAMARETLR